MNSVENSLSKILTDAEAAVLKVLSDAAAAGDYAAIDHARALAEKLRNLHQGLGKSDIGKRESVGRGPARPTTRKRQLKKRSGKKKGYPKFEFRDGSLYKLGWSRKKNDEYVHRVPVAAVKIVSDALQGFTGTADPVSSEQILESDPVKGNIPSYQVYIVLAFLKDKGLIKAVGRDGFQLPLEITSQVDEIVREEATQ